MVYGIGPRLNNWAGTTSADTLDSGQANGELADLSLEPTHRAEDPVIQSAAA
jgi:hypothetical protein